MSQHMTTAKKEAADYAAKREREAREAIERANAEAAEQTAEIQEQTAAALRAEDRERALALNTAAIQNEIERQQVRETVARLGLTGSGLERARTAAANESARRASSAANAGRDTAVAALKAALAKREKAIEKERAQTEASEQQKAADDIAADYQKRITAAEKQIEKEQKEQESAEKKAQEKAESEAKSAATRAEQQRMSALGRLQTDDKISAEIYAKAVEQGWSAQKALDEHTEEQRVKTIVNEAVVRKKGQGLVQAMLYLREQQLNGTQWNTVCEALGITRAEANRWISELDDYLARHPGAEQLSWA